MKKILFLLALLLLPLGTVKAQKIALVDMEFILKKDPSYAVMNRQIEDLSKKWQAEVSSYEKQAEEAYKSFQSEAAFLSAQQKKQREEAIVALEKQGYELKRKYFGPEGDLFKKREALMKPIQDEIYNAVKEIANDKGYQMVIDRASAGSMIFASPRIDISNEVLTKLGYAK